MKFSFSIEAAQHAGAEFWYDVEELDHVDEYTVGYRIHEFVKINGVSTPCITNGDNCLVITKFFRDSKNFELSLLSLGIVYTRSLEEAA